VVAEMQYSPTMVVVVVVEVVVVVGVIIVVGVRNDERKC